MAEIERQMAFRIPALARTLGLSEAAARRMVERGEIPSRKWGRRVVVLRDDLQAYLASLRERGAA